jgi:hypothetical protein
MFDHLFAVIEFWIASINFDVEIQGKLDRFEQYGRVNALKFSIIKNTYKSDKNLICEGYKAYAHR